jgi:hypothetical protein
VGGAQLLLKIVQSVKKSDMKILCDGIGHILRSLEWRCQNREKSTITNHLLGIFGIFKGGKGSLDGKYGKFYLINILYIHQAKKKLI